jgi:hypothetical protein
LLVDVSGSLSLPVAVAPRPAIPRSDIAALNEDESGAGLDDDRCGRRRRRSLIDLHDRDRLGDPSLAFDEAARQRAGERDCTENVLKLHGVPPMSWPVEQMWDQADCQ